jgi:hypothetical protein
VVESAAPQPAVEDSEAVAAAVSAVVQEDLQQVRAVVEPRVGDEHLSAVRVGDAGTWRSSSRPS